MLFNWTKKCVTHLRITDPYENVTPFGLRGIQRVKWQKMAASIGPNESEPSIFFLLYLLTII